MFDARSVKRLILLAVLGAGIGGIAVPSMAQMGATIERDITSNAVQQAVQSARDRSQQSKGTASKKSDAAAAAKKPVQAAKKESKESKEARKPDAGTPQ